VTSGAVATIVLSGISFEGRHGVSTAERLSTRRFEVDVEIEADVSAAERSDRLRDTIDYTRIGGIVVAVGTSEPHHLLESLARRMLDALAAAFAGTRITLELRKMSPPGCPGHPAYSAVRLRSPAA
jgi:dihydroneopterin aldolase